MIRYNEKQNKQYHTIGTVPKSNQKIVEREAKIDRKWLG
jgi:hypothetical protein